MEKSRPIRACPTPCTHSFKGTFDEAPHMTRNLLLLMLVIASLPALAKGRVAEQLCSQPHFHCIEAQKGQKWKDLWPDDERRHLIMRLNRMNTGLIPKMKI